MLQGLLHNLFRRKRNIHIRRAINADVFEVIALIKKVRYAYGLPVDLKAKDHDLLDIEHYYQNGVFLVAEEEGKLIACAALHFQKDGISHMSKLYVDRFYRRMGLGRELMEMLIAYAQERRQHQIFARIPHKMRQAQKFFAQLGFTKQQAKTANSDRSAEAYVLDLRH